nr:hypothetical protein [Tanacetum cinerariifolium]
TTLVAVTPKNQNQQVRRTPQITKSEKPSVDTSTSPNIDSNTPVLSSTGVALASSASGSQSKDNTKKKRIRRTLKKAKETKLEDHPRKVKSSLNKASVVDSRASSSKSSDKSLTTKVDFQKGREAKKTAADAKVPIQEMAEYSSKWCQRISRTRSTKSFDGLVDIQAQLNNLGREIKNVNESVYAAQVGCEQCKGPHYTKDFPLKEEGKTLEEAYYKASVSAIPLSTYLNLDLGELAHTKLTVKFTDRTVKYPKGIAENMLLGIGKLVLLVDFIILDMLEDINVPLILGKPFFSTAYAKIDVFNRKIPLRVEEEKIIFNSVKPTSSLIKRVYMLCLKERMEHDLEDRLMGETLVLNISLDPFFEDYIELNNFNVPLELRRYQVDKLMPTIEVGEVIKEFRARNEAIMISNFFRYPGDCDHDKKICIDCAHNLKFSCMIVMSSPNHPTTDVKDAFSFNFLHYTTTSPNYFPSSLGNISPDPQDNLSKYLLASLAISPFHDMQAYNAVANKPPIPPQDPITPQAILTPSLQIYLPSSSSTMLSNSSWKQACILVPPSFSTCTPTQPQIYELGISSIKMRVKHHEEQVESILNYTEELSFHRNEKMEERLVNGWIIIPRDFDEVKTNLKEAHT